MGQHRTMDNIHDPSRAVRQDTLVLFLAWSAQQHWPFCRYFLLVYNSQDSSLRELSTAVSVLYGSFIGETTEETRPQRSRGQIGVGWLQDAVRRAARWVLPSSEIGFVRLLSDTVLKSVPKES